MSSTLLSTPHFSHLYKNRLQVLCLWMICFTQFPKFDFKNNCLELDLNQTKQPGKCNIEASQKEKKLERVSKEEKMNVYHPPTTKPHASGEEQEEINKPKHSMKQPKRLSKVLPL
ncbi:hypothetical protein Tco_0332019 [Tanacetum coccineum]